MILIGLGANLPSEQYGPPRAALGAALHTLDQNENIKLTRHSSWFESAPVPISSQPWYINGVAEIETSLSTHRLVATLLEIEASVGRVRGAANAARVLDLDLLVYGDCVDSSADEEGVTATVPHPRMTERAFVLLPLHELSPRWCHPLNNKSIHELIGALPKGQDTRKLLNAGGFYGTEWPGPK